MKYFIGILIVGVIVVGGFFLLRNPGTGQEATTTPGEGASADATGTSQLIVIADTVSIQHPGDTAPVAITDTASVSQGDRIVTSDGGRARLAYPDGTITTLEPSTDIIVSELSNQGSKSRITLNVGDIWSKITRVLGSDDHYEVQTNETVAAVRGTVFRSIYRNKRSVIQGIEHNVRVFARNQDGSTDEASGTDVGEESQVDVDATMIATPAGKRHLLARKLTRAELLDPVFERIRKERNLRNDQIDRPQRGRTPLVSPKATPTPRPTVSAVISLPPRVMPSIPTIPSDGLPPISSILPYVSDLPSSTVKLQYVSPKVITPGAEFTVNGSGFMSGRTPNVNGVLVGYQPAEFHIIDGQTIFVTTPQLSPGVYEISVSTAEGSIINLKPGITIQ